MAEKTAIQGADYAAPRHDFGAFSSDQVIERKRFY
jgi:hypothetical protein